MKNIVNVINFSKKFKNIYVLNNINFSVKKGSFNAILGTNGSGKTTLINAILGKFTSYTGEISFYSKSIKNASVKKNIGYIPEKIVFPNNISIIKYLTYIGFISGLTKVEAKKLGLRLLKKYSLLKYKDKLPNKLSAGESKKLALVQALINNPKILIMDEPTSNFDPIAINNFYSNISELHKNGMTILICTHKLNEIKNLADKIIILDSGKILFSGSTKKFISANDNIVKEFINIVNKNSEKNA